MDKTLIKKAIAECFGTFVLVFFAVGTAVVTGGNIVATALAFGLVIVAMAYSIGSISGCHINPAVSLGVLIAKKGKGFTPVEFAVYVAAQFVGAIIGALALYSIQRMAWGTSLSGLSVWGTNEVMRNYMENLTAGGFIASILLEVILTFVFVYVILVVTTKKETLKKAGLIIGLTLTLVHLLGIALTGTSVNPARSFGPAFVRIFFDGLNPGRAIAEYWVFLIAPLAGGALAALAFMFFNKDDKEEGETKSAKE